MTATTRLLGSNEIVIAPSGIARRLEPVPEGSAVHMSFDHMTIGTIDGRIYAKKRLYVIVARFVSKNVDAPERSAIEHVARMRNLCMMSSFGPL